MTGRTRLYTILLLGFVCAIGAGLGEISLRILFPEFLERPTQYTSDGVRKGRLTKFLTEVRETGSEYVIIGDSFVGTGNGRGGWVRALRALSNKKVSAFGQPGAAPGQYFSVYDQVRTIDPDVPILILLYVGNDLVDETILSSVTPNREQYGEAHRKVYSDPETAPYFPCFGGAGRIERSSLARKIASVRLSVLVFRRVKKGLAVRADPNRHPLEKEFFERCHRGPHSVLVNDRNFFFDLHDTLVDPESAENRASERKILSYLRDRATDQNLTIAVMLDREEVCREFHGVVIKDGERLISAFAEAGVRTLNPNPIFANSCQTENLYLPDRHWNFEGHKLFARVIRDQWIKRDGDVDRVIHAVEGSGPPHGHAIKSRGVF